MNSRRSVGTILLGLGALLIILGVSASRSLADSMSSAASGHMTRSTLWFISGGVSSALAGSLLVLGAFGRKRA